MVRELHEAGRVAVTSFVEGVPLNLVGRILPKVLVVPPETAFPGARPLLALRFQGVWCASLGGWEVRPRQACAACKGVVVEVVVLQNQDSWET